VQQRFHDVLVMNEIDCFLQMSRAQVSLLLLPLVISLSGRNVFRIYDHWHL
jgi:hypothetical protein